ncbi:TIGR04149 family rSAM-modified RiPP [Mucilaginibacter sp.]|uniref:TIGR04149 family rSAM-modified RiPP n=1 Tax=Mucilaginibacter sp. TaxID=1882438 RepID=UPI003568C79B
MKKLSLKLTGIKEALGKNEMKQIRGGSGTDCYDQCSSYGTACSGGGTCAPSSCHRYGGGDPYRVCI